MGIKRPESGVLKKLRVRRDASGIYPTPRASVLFFQAEDGIRDSSETGVQTCALPILVRLGRRNVAGRTTRSSNPARLRDRACRPSVHLPLLRRRGSVLVLFRGTRPDRALPK